VVGARGRARARARLSRGAIHGRRPRLEPLVRVCGPAFTNARLRWCWRRAERARCARRHD